MYVTAYRVRCPDDRRLVNAVLYQHEGSSAPPDLWERPNVLDLVTQTHPGRRVAEHLPAVPGGNAIESFLDVVAPDETKVGEVSRVLEKLRAVLEGGSPRERIQVEAIWAEFSVILGEAERLAWFDELRREVLSLLTSHERVAVGEEPIVVDVTLDEAGVRFRLNDSSAERAADVGGYPAVPRRSVGMTAAVRQQFESQYGPAWPHVGEWLTGLDRAALLRLGGLRFVERGRELARWPA